MYLVPFSMGPIGGKLSKNGIELTDSSYVAVSMRVMTRVGSAVLKCIAEDNGSFVKCLHTVGQPLKPGQEDMAWPCNPEKVGTFAPESFRSQNVQFVPKIVSFKMCKKYS